MNNIGGMREIDKGTLELFCTNGWQGVVGHLVYDARRFLQPVKEGEVPPSIDDFTVSLKSAAILIRILLPLHGYVGDISYEDARDLILAVQHNAESKKQRFNTFEALDSFGNILSSEQKQYFGPDLSNIRSYSLGHSPKIPVRKAPEVGKDGIPEPSIPRTPALPDSVKTYERILKMRDTPKDSVESVLNAQFLGGMVF
ncbi:hypothetical protein BDQ17DRAFT_1366700 [Cyathus striatus]|nr:hypothetical protein BDQ17DRAFT_1366700 [Cyathus striatus]